MRARGRPLQILVCSHCPAQPLPCRAPASALHPRGPLMKKRPWILSGHTVPVEISQSQQHGHLERHLKFPTSPGQDGPAGFALCCEMLCNSPIPMLWLGWSGLATETKTTHSTVIARPLLHSCPWRFLSLSHKYCSVRPSTGLSEVLKFTCPLWIITSQTTIHFPSQHLNIQLSPAHHTECLPILIAIELK